MNANYYVGVENPLARIEAAQKMVQAAYAKIRRVQQGAVGDPLPIPPTGKMKVNGWGFCGSDAWGLSTPHGDGPRESERGVFLAHLTPSKLEEITKGLEEKTAAFVAAVEQYEIDQMKENAARLAEAAPALRALTSASSLAHRLRAAADELESPPLRRNGEERS